jgi:hypothetical protein
LFAGAQNHHGMFSQIMEFGGSQAYRMARLQERYRAVHQAATVIIFEMRFQCATGSKCSPA